MGQFRTKYSRRNGNDLELESKPETSESDHVLRMWSWNRSCQDILFGVGICAVSVIFTPSLARVGIGVRAIQKFSDCLPDERCCISGEETGIGRSSRHGLQ